LAAASSALGLAALAVACQADTSDKETRADAPTSDRGAPRRATLSFQECSALPGNRSSCRTMRETALGGGLPVKPDPSPTAPVSDRNPLPPPKAKLS
jgi:hypothetical protein